jgi:hypothetical protein
MRVFPPCIAAAAMVAALLRCAAGPAGDTAAPAIVLTLGKSPSARFEVRGLPPDVLKELRKLRLDDPRWSSIFGVSVPAGVSIDQPPMLGAYELAGEAVRFKPRFPLERRVAYRAVFDGRKVPGVSGNAVRIEVKFMLSLTPSGPPARVVAIYPSAGELPENLLRFYVQFSAPMSQGGSYGFVSLRDSTGAEIERPFLELPQELWSPDGTRLTLLLEPGRVKHGLVPRAELGPILSAGRSYTLTVDAKWPDAEGRPLKDSARKAFRAVKADATQPDPRSWKIEPPRAGSRESLSVRFRKPLDQAMLQHMLRVLYLGAARGPTPVRTEVVGAVRIADEEKLWTFEPRDPWPSGRYALAASTKLEDAAGNSIGRPFEVDLNRSQPAKRAAAAVQIEFHVRERP